MEKEIENKITNEQAKLLVKVLYRQCGISSNNGQILINEGDLIQWFANNSHLGKYTEYDTI